MQFWKQIPMHHHGIFFLGCRQIWPEQPGKCPYFCSPSEPRVSGSTSPVMSSLSRSSFISFQQFIQQRISPGWKVHWPCLLCDWHLEGVILSSVCQVLWWVWHTGNFMLTVRKVLLSPFGDRQVCPPDLQGQYEMKMWGPLFKISKNFKVSIAEHKIEPGILRNTGCYVTAQIVCTISQPNIWIHWCLNKLNDLPEVTHSAKGRGDTEIHVCTIPQATFLPPDNSASDMVRWGW